VDTLDNTQAHCAQLHTNDKNRAAIANIIRAVKDRPFVG